MSSRRLIALHGWPTGEQARWRWVIRSLPACSLPSFLPSFHSFLLPLLPPSLPSVHICFLISRHLFFFSCLPSVPPARYTWSHVYWLTLPFFIVSFAIGSLSTSIFVSYFLFFFLPSVIYSLFIHSHFPFLSFLPSMFPSFLFFFFLFFLFVLPLNIISQEEELPSNSLIDTF